MTTGRANRAAKRRDVDRLVRDLGILGYEDRSGHLVDRIRGEIAELDARLGLGILPGDTSGDVLPKRRRLAGRIAAAVGDEKTALVALDDRYGYVCSIRNYYQG
jgi:hypothetical protein